MKLYVVSGLGADFKVLERLRFNPAVEVVFLDWLMPEKKESFKHYVQRMTDRIDDSEPYYLLGYSFGGIIVQEINRLKPAEKVVILGSIKSDKEKSRLLKLGQRSRVPQYLPVNFYGGTTLRLYTFLRRNFFARNSTLMNYFQVRDAYYLKWSIQRIVEWQHETDSNVIQILADRDRIFPLANSRPDYVIKDATHLFPATRHKEISLVLQKIFV